MNMLQTIIPKSDQLNSDDLIGRTMTITVTDVRMKPGDEQPVSLHFEGDGGKPYKACKSMRRVLVHVWGADAKNYVGRSMTLYRDPEVSFGGQKVGGIRISHMSHMESPMTMALTATRASRKPYTVKPLVVAATPTGPTVADYEACADAQTFAALEERRKEAWTHMDANTKRAVKAAVDACAARVQTVESAADAH